MSTILTDLRAKIVVMLQGISQIHAIYDYEPDKPEDGKYPFATISFLESEGEFGDTIRNLRTDRFAIRIYQERTEAAFGNQKAETILMTILDAVYTAFDADTTLGGLVKWVKPISARGEFVEREVGDVRMAEIIIEAMSVVPSI